MGVCGESKETYTLPNVKQSASANVLCDKVLKNPGDPQLIPPKPPQTHIVCSHSLPCECKPVRNSIYCRKISIRDYFGQIAILKSSKLLHLKMLKIQTQNLIE